MSTETIRPTGHSQSTSGIGSDFSQDMANQYDNNLTTFGVTSGNSAGAGAFSVITTLGTTWQSKTQTWTSWSIGIKRRYLCASNGDNGGGNVKLEYSTDSGSNWTTYENVAVTDGNDSTVQTLTVATGSGDLTAANVRVKATITSNGTATSGDGVLYYIYEVWLDGTYTASVPVTVQSAGWSAVASWGAAQIQIKPSCIPAGWAVNATWGATVPMNLAGAIPGGWGASVTWAEVIGVGGIQLSVPGWEATSAWGDAGVGISDATNPAGWSSVGSWGPALGTSIDDAAPAGWSVSASWGDAPSAFTMEADSSGWSAVTFWGGVHIADSMVTPCGWAAALAWGAAIGDDSPVSTTHIPGVETPNGSAGSSSSAIPGMSTAASGSTSAAAVPGLSGPVLAGSTSTLSIPGTAA